MPLSSFSPAWPACGLWPASSCIFLHRLAGMPVGRSPFLPSCWPTLCSSAATCTYTERRIRVHALQLLGAVYQITPNTSIYICSRNSFDL
ncbi:hypothetical protein BU24DRAFT_418234 [Aaosphaeria arxii CBS 175.79]|uniref:Uncharacterized protein n=1 Tax=Aaosphaeria arxii CBS 175.79 TaxID=1450172 RepID=A0A6A5XZS4_9PLEO|nr:uncharacterized protein BU24DRAFT_418234 [Aaosphaeria arxii CBS 175.79]KAF2018702.1 hypothetical protein BU24DRAFT_418234 [Aaosphaeria arxii CBS 175.79]